MIGSHVARVRPISQSNLSMLAKKKKPPCVLANRSSCISEPGETRLSEKKCMLKITRNSVYLRFI